MLFMILLLGNCCNIFWNIIMLFMIYYLVIVIYDIITW